MSSLLSTLALLALIVVGSALCCPAQSGEGRAASETEAGFETIFDGKTLKGWEGDTRYWRVEAGSLVGEVTPATILKKNSFIIWRGGATRDFELKVEYRNFRLKTLRAGSWLSIEA